MDLKDSISIIAQTENGQFSENGIQYVDSNVIGVNSQLGLMVLTSGESQGEQAAAFKAVEIMMDDMQLNLTSKNSKSKYQGSIALRCMTESLDNINEYLYSHSETDIQLKQPAGVDLAAVQILQNVISSCSVGGLQCLKFSDNKLQVLSDDSKAEDKLGIETSFKPDIVEQAFTEGDIVVLLASSLIKELGQEFIRLTLSRFNENLEMALRQINTRALKNGLKHKPNMIICRKNQVVEERRSWFQKLRN